MITSFYNDKEMKYTEIGIVLEKAYYTSKFKVAIPVLLPEVSTSTAFTESKTKPAVSNIMNKTARDKISTYTISNYIDLYIPTYMTSGITDKYGYIEKGTKLLITFIGGEVNKPAVIGVM